MTPILGMPCGVMFDPGPVEPLHVIVFVILNEFDPFAGSMGAGRDVAEGEPQSLGPAREELEPSLAGPDADQGEGGNDLVGTDQFCSEYVIMSTARGRGQDQAAREVDPEGLQGRFDLSASPPEVGIIAPEVDVDCEPAGLV